MLRLVSFNFYTLKTLFGFLQSLLASIDLVSSHDCPLGCGLVAIGPSVNVMEENCRP